MTGTTDVFKSLQTSNYDSPTNKPGGRGSIELDEVNPRSTYTAPRKSKMPERSSMGFRASNALASI